MRHASYCELAGGIYYGQSFQDCSVDIASSNPGYCAATSCCLCAGFPGTPDRFAVYYAGRQLFVLFDKQERSSSSAFYYDEEKKFRNGHMALLPFLNTFGRVDNGRKYREENEMAEFRDADSGWKKILYTGWELYCWFQMGCS